MEWSAQQPKPVHESLPGRVLLLSRLPPALAAAGAEGSAKGGAGGPAGPGKEGIELQEMSREGSSGDEALPPAPQAGAGAGAGGNNGDRPGAGWCGLCGALCAGSLCACWDAARAGPEPPPAVWQAAWVGGEGGLGAIRVNRHVIADQFASRLLGVLGDLSGEGRKNGGKKGGGAAAAAAAAGVGAGQGSKAEATGKADCTEEV